MSRTPQMLLCTNITLLLTLKANARANVLLFLDISAAHSASARLLLQLLL